MAKEDGTAYTGEKKPPMESKVSTKSVKKISVMFRGNRKFDLHIGRDMITFRGREVKKIPETWLKHRDWVNVSKLFIVKGV